MKTRHVRLSADERHAVWCRQQWQTVPRAAGVPKSWPPRLPIQAPLIELDVLHKVILLVLAGYPSAEAYKRAETEEELRQREHTIAAELAKLPELAMAVEEAKQLESLDPIYFLAGLTMREIGAFERAQGGMPAKQIAREMSTNKDRPEVTVMSVEGLLRKAGAKLRRLSEPAAVSALTGRQADAVEMFLDGHSYGQISTALEIGRETARTHVRRGLNKSDALKEGRE